jgi:putative phosphoribosyl transferase
LATGTTMLAAVKAVRQLGPNEVTVAVPLAAPSTCHAFDRIVDRIVCGETPDAFYALGLWYEDFAPTTDQEVRSLLADAERRPGIRSSRNSEQAGVSREPERSDRNVPLRG